MRATPRGSRRIDLAGLTVLPGLIDCHVHLLAHIRPVQEEHSERLSHRTYRGIPWAAKTLEAGVTTGGVWAIPPCVVQAVSS